MGHPVLSKYVSSGAGTNLKWRAHVRRKVPYKNCIMLLHFFGSTSTTSSLVSALVSAVQFGQFLVCCFYSRAPRKRRKAARSPVPDGIGGIVCKPVRLKFHLARLDSTHSTCRAHAFWLCRASRTAQLDSLETSSSTRSTGSTRRARQTLLAT